MIFSNSLIKTDVRLIYLDTFLFIMQSVGFNHFVNLQFFILFCLTIPLVLDHSFFFTFDMHWFLWVFMRGTTHHVGQDYFTVDQSNVRKYNFQDHG